MGVISVIIIAVNIKIVPIAENNVRDSFKKIIPKITEKTDSKLIIIAAGAGGKYFCPTT